MGSTLDAVHGRSGNHSLGLTRSTSDSLWVLYYTKHRKPSGVPDPVVPWSPQPRPSSSRPGRHRRQACGF